MSSVQSTVQNIVLNNYGTVALITVIGYDYILTLPREIEYIWSKPWTPVSTLFVFVRYLGLCAYMIFAIFVGIFLRAFYARLIHGHFEGGDLDTVSLWAVFGFICAIDFVMILRAWAMWNRSKIILGILLTTYAGEVIPSIISCIFYSSTHNFTVTVSQILDFSFCSLQVRSATWNEIADTTQLIHAAMVCVVVIIQFTRQLFQGYRTTNQWQSNRFMNLLFVQGVLYFLCFLVWNIVNTLVQWGKITVEGWEIVPIALVEDIPMVTLPCRFILSVRELYACNVQGGQRDRIDSGFGLSTLSTRSEATMVFAEDAGRGEELEVGEGIPMELIKL